MSYFQEALANFVQDFSDGGAIRHMADRGYTLDQIMRSGHVSLSREKVKVILDKYLEEKAKENPFSK